MVQKYLEKGTSSPKKKKGRNRNADDSGNCGWLSGRMHIEERRTIERRAAASVYKLGTDTMAVDGIMYGHTYSKSMDQPGKVANPARGQLNRENEYFPVRIHSRLTIWSRETDGFGSPVLRQPAHLHYCLLMEFLPSSAAAYNRSGWLFHPPVGYSLIYPTTWISRLKTRLVTVHA